MERGVKLTLTKAEYDELLLTTSFEKDELTAIKDNFAAMQTDPVVFGKVSLSEFCKFLKMKEDNILAQKLFEKLDFNKDSYLTFFDILNSIDNFHQKQFKSKLKFYFELFCDQDKEISRAKLLKISKEVLDQFPHLVLPDGILLDDIDRGIDTKLNPMVSVPTIARRKSALSKDENKDHTNTTITLDEFYDHFEKVFPSLA
jgi:Ca2+-binding EF-hand superfamily protein